MSFFCLAMEKHREDIITAKLSPYLCYLFRPIAWILLLINFYISGQLYGWSIGPAVFFGALAGSLIPLILLLTYQAKIIPVVAITLPIVAYIILQIELK
jgi:hypothetical protein